MVDNSQLNTPGEILASARRKAGLSLDEVALRTKIQWDMLQAIERDEYHKISGDLYVKSFMGSFAREVGVDPELVVAMYKDFSGETSEAVSGGGGSLWEEETVEVTSVGLPWIKLTIIAVIVFALVAALYFFVLRDPGQEGVTVNDTGTVAAAVSQTTELPSAEPKEGAGDTVVFQVLVEDTLPKQVPGANIAPRDVRLDTLSLGWQNSPPIVEEIIPEEKPTEKPAVSSYTTVEDSASRILAASGRGHLPTAFPGNEHVDFKGRESWPVVLRLVCEKPVDLQIKRDAESSFSSVVWPSAGADAAPLPAKNLVAGHAYAVRQGFAVYWGAGDHFSLKLPANEGFELSVNGIVRNISRIKPGQEIIIDAPAESVGP